MAYVMTAAAVAMVRARAFGRNDALGIQRHQLAMFGPKIFTGSLMVCYGNVRGTAVGMVLPAASGLVAPGGLTLSHFCGSLALLVRLEFPLHRRDGDDPRLLPPSGAQQCAWHERLVRARRHGRPVVPHGLVRAKLG